jgi:hypothetical protein
MENRAECVDIILEDMVVMEESWMKCKSKKQVLVRCWGKGLT